MRLNPEAVIRRLHSLRLGGIYVPMTGPDGLSEFGEDMTTAICKDLRWLELYKRLVETVNMNLYRRYDDDINAAIGAIRGTAHHYWLSERKGVGTLSRVHPINHSYFTRYVGADEFLHFLAKLHVEKHRGDRVYRKSDC